MTTTRRRGAHVLAKALRAAFLVLLPAALPVGVAGNCPAQETEQQLYAAIYARVNGQAVTAIDVMDSMNYVALRRLPGPMPDDPELLDQIRVEAVREQVIANLVFDEAKAMKLEVPRLPAQANIDRFLSASGLTESKLRPAVRRILEADALLDVILMRKGMPPPQPPPARVREFYERNRMTIFRDNLELVVRHIYISPGLSRDMGAVRQFMEQIRARVAAQPTPAARNATFAEIARGESQDQFAADGGRLNLLQTPEGFIPQNLPNPDNNGQPLFPDAMVRGIRNITRADELSPVIVSDRGAHLMYCEKTRGGQIRSFREAHPMINYHLEQLRRRENINAWLRDKHRRSLIYWNDGTPYEIDELIPPPAERQE